MTPHCPWDKVPFLWLAHKVLSIWAPAEGHYHPPCFSHARLLCLPQTGPALPHVHPGLSSVLLLPEDTLLCLSPLLWLIPTHYSGFTFHVAPTRLWWGAPWLPPQSPELHLLNYVTLGTYRITYIYVHTWKLWNIIITTNTYAPTNPP